jgi:hypothetical protein
METHVGGAYILPRSSDHSGLMETNFGLIYSTIVETHCRTVDAHSENVNARSRAIEARSRALKSHISDLTAHPGATGAHSGVWKLMSSSEGFLCSLCAMFDSQEIGISIDNAGGSRSILVLGINLELEPDPK